MKWKRDIVILIVFVVGVPAYMVHETGEAAPPIMPQSQLRVELIKTQPDFIETLVTGDDMTGCDLNGDGLCDGADIQPFVNAKFN